MIGGYDNLNSLYLPTYGTSHIVIVLSYRFQMTASCSCTPGQNNLCDCGWLLNCNSRKIYDVCKQKGEVKEESPEQRLVVIRREDYYG